MKLKSGKITMANTDETQGTSSQQAGDYTQTQPQTDTLSQLMNMLREMSNKLDDNTKSMNGKLDENTKKLNENALEINNKMEKFETKLDKIQEEVREEINSKIHAVRDELRMELQDHVETLVVGSLSSLNEKIQKQNETYDTCIKEQERKIAQNTKLINDISKTTHTTYTHIKTVTDTDFHFHGDASMHPKIFLNRLRQHLTTLHDIHDVKPIIQNKLKGDAELWYQMIEDRFETYEQFEELLIKQYWGEYNQQKVRQSLFNGKYNESYGVSRERYVMRKVYNIRYLEPKFTEGEMVRYLARHFDDDVHNVIITQRINTLDGLIEYVRSIDDHRLGRRNPAPRDNRQNYDNIRNENRHSQTEHKQYNDNNRQNYNENRNYNSNNTRQNFNYNNNQNRQNDNNYTNRYNSNYNRGQSTYNNNNTNTTQEQGKRQVHWEDRHTNENRSIQNTQQGNRDTRTYAQVANTNIQHNNSKNSHNKQEEIHKIQTDAQMHTRPQNQDF